MKIAIYGARRQGEFANDILQLVEFIVNRGDSLVIHEKIKSCMVDTFGPDFAKIIDGQTIVNSPDFSADIAISIGGDGTFLRTAQWVGDKEIPIIGVNTGHLGFLAPFSVEEAIQALADDCLSTYTIIGRTVLQVESPFTRLDEWPYALNEVAFLKRDSASMIAVDARVNNANLAEYLCDGLIISTPTGSTGYNLSVGGPIIQPGVASLVLSPIAAHSLSMRPLVIDNSSMLEMKVYSRSSSYRLSLDGRSLNMPCGTSIFITRAPFVINTVQKPDHNFYTTLREKLLWGATLMENKLK